MKNTESGSNLVTQQSSFAADYLLKDVFADMRVNSAQWIV